MNQKNILVLLLIAIILAINLQQQIQAQTTKKTQEDVNKAFLKANYDLTLKYPNNVELAKTIGNDTVNLVQVYAESIQNKTSSLSSSSSSNNTNSTCSTLFLICKEITLCGGNGSTPQIVNC